MSNSKDAIVPAVSKPSSVKFYDSSRIEKSKFKVAYIHSDSLDEYPIPPTVPDRAKIVYQLICSYNLLDYVTVIEPELATVQQLCSFHSEEYIEFLSKINAIDEDSFYDLEELDAYGLGYDCPYIPHIFDTVAAIAGATITAAEVLNEGTHKISMNWNGGWHHANKDHAAGFCYINDIVLGILTLLKKFKRVMYVDLDAHHGDGVEDAFYFTSRVLCLSVHKYEVGFYPGSGALSSIGSGRGKYYTVNVPLLDGITDDQYINLILPILSSAYEKFQPDAVVCQCGGDALSRDPTKSLNLTFQAPAECVKMLVSWDVPLLFLGGGGYDSSLAARYWTYLFSLLAEVSIPVDIPDHENFLMFGPDYEICISPRICNNDNTDEYLNKLKTTILGNLNYIESTTNI